MSSPDPDKSYIRLHPSDNVVTLPWGGKKGDVFGSFTLRGDVPPGHKAACADIEEGGLIIKYGRPVAVASRAVLRGEHVHGHNAETRLSEQADLPERHESAPPGLPKISGGTFLGFGRKSGRAGIRNDLWLIPTVGCVNGELRSILRNYRKPPWVDAVRLLEHPYGCSQLGGDLEATRDVLAGLACNPNAGGVLLVGLGCENLQLDVLEKQVRETRRDPLMSLSLQTLEPGADPAEILPRLLDELAEKLPRARQPFPLSDLCVGVKCGGSDGYSGLTANPLVGRFSDWLVSRGGTVLATEIPEMFGAEDVIASRISDEPVFRDFIALDRWFRDYFVRYGQPVCENPSPGNRAGGITTLEEKSLGAVEKTGSAPVTRVLRYGEPISADGGVQIAFAPGNDLVSCTALAAAGAQAILFTTGRGTPFGCVVPTVKISTNTPLAERRPGWIDFDAGALLTGEPWEIAEQRLADCVLRVAAGEKTAHERKDFGDIALFKDGVTL